MKRGTKQRRRAIKGYSVVLRVPCGGHNIDHKSLTPSTMATNRPNAHRLAHTHTVQRLHTTDTNTHSLNVLMGVLHFSVWAHADAHVCARTHTRTNPHQYAIIVPWPFTLTVYWLWPEGPIKRHQLYRPNGNVSWPRKNTHTQPPTPTHTHTHTQAHPHSHACGETQITTIIAYGVL